MAYPIPGEAGSRPGELSTGAALSGQPVPPVAGEQPPPWGFQSFRCRSVPPSLRKKNCCSTWSPA